MMKSVIQIVKLPTFEKQSYKIISSTEYKELTRHLLSHPQYGIRISKGGGLRKLRWSRLNIGKRKGIRIIYYYYQQKSIIYLVYIYKKNQKHDLTIKEIKLLANIIEHIKKGNQNEL